MKRLILGCFAAIWLAASPAEGQGRIPPFMRKPQAAPAASTLCTDAHDAGTARYVRNGGTGSGTSWSDAWGTLADAESSLTRGQTLCVGNGSIGASPTVLNVATSGTQTITIVKATVADHGTETGWNSAYAAQADVGWLRFDSDYWILNGATRNEGDWSDETTYGFAASYISSDTAQAGFCADEVEVSYVAINAGDGTSRPIFIGTSNCLVWTFSNLKIENSGELQFAGCGTVILEDSWLESMFGKETIRAQNTCPGITIRRNVFAETCQAGAEGCTATIGIFDNGSPGDYSPIRIYGNVIYNTTGAASRSNNNIQAEGSDCLIFNNTLYNYMNGGQGGIACLTGGTVQNNISYYPNGMTAGCSGTCSNNTEDTAAPPPPFVSVASLDFHLTEALAGSSASSPSGNETDLDGVSRGGDGTWDRGAFEFTEP